MTAEVQSKKKNLVMSLKGLDAKMNWLTVNCDFDFDFELRAVVEDRLEEKSVVDKTPTTDQPWRTKLLESK
jgi:hypothetical protein